MYLKEIKFMMKTAKGMPSNGIKVTRQPAVLYVTDDADTAKQLQQNKDAVLIYLHSGNSGQDFSQFLFAVEDPENLEEAYVEKVYRRLKGLPWDILETQRCLIRETIIDDAEDFYRIYSDPSVTKYIDDLYPEIEQEKQYIREYIEKVYTFFEFGVWTVVEKKSGAVIGRAGISYREGFDNPELGYIIGVPWQRKGYATEVCEAILQYAKEELGFAKIQALVEPDNIASLQLCEKLGMRLADRVVVKGKEYLQLVTA